MSDIHIGKIYPLGDGRKKVDIVFHIPIYSPVPGIVLTPTSSLLSISSEEQTKLTTGTLVEKGFKVLKVDNFSDFLKIMFKKERAKFNTEYDINYLIFGQTIDATD